jgi:hypothetical protein
LIEDLAEIIEQALLDLREAVRWLGVAYPYSGRGRNMKGGMTFSNERGMAFSNGERHGFFE